MAIFDTKPNTSKFRIPQEEGLKLALAHFANEGAEKQILMQIPTGVGKTALIAALPFGLSQKKVLILSPNLHLAGQIEDDLDIISNPENNIYKKLGILPNIDQIELFVLKLEDSANLADIEESHIIIANYQQLQDVEKWFKGKEDGIDLIIIDEAHHQQAKTYQNIIKFFPSAKIINLTATPFRSDGQKIEGKNIYTYHFSDAVRKGYIRNITTINVTPEEVSISFSDDEGKKYSLEEIMKMKEESWFRRNIALSEEACDSIAKKALEKLEELKKDFPNELHQIIAAAMHTRHAREIVKPAFEKLGLKVGLVSYKDGATNKEEMMKLKQGKIDVIINVGMLGEGFDHKPLGVAAIFRPFASLNPYIQFIGRVIRHHGDTSHCFVVSHLGLNQGERFKEFRLFDSEDKAFMEQLLANPEKNKQVNGVPGEESLVDDDEVVEEEITINQVGDKVLEFESEFIKMEKVENAKKIIESLSPEEKNILFTKLGIEYDKVKEGKLIGRIKPKDKRRSEKNLLNEKEKSMTADILRVLGLKSRFFYRDFNPLSTNFKWVKQKISKEVDKCLGITTRQRNSLSYDQISDFINGKAMDRIKSEVEGYFKKKLDERNAK